MKTLKTNFTFLLTVLLSNFITARAQTTDVVWVHGYGDTNTQWAEYADLFNHERQMTFDNTFYRDNDNGIVNMAGDINSRIGSNDANTIIVGHSMGGVAAAEADQGVKGIITFGSPMDGAHIADAVATGKIANETKHGVREMLAGPKAQFNVLYIIATIVSKDITGEWLGRMLEDKIVDEIGYDHYSTHTSVQNLRTNSAFMTDKNRYRLSTPKISVWGNENSPVHWRTASSAVSGGSNDTEIVNIASISRSVYLAFQRDNEAGATVTFIGGFLNPLSWIASAYFGYSASQWKRGKDYLDSSETTWKWLMGAYRNETATYTTYEKLPCFPDDPYGRVAPIEIDCDRWGYVTHTYTKTVKEPSDGFIDKGSQLGTKATNWNPTAVEALGVNHMEMGTHPVTEQILRNAWDGIYGTPFTIPR